MNWKQREFDEVTKALQATLDELPAKGNLTRVASLRIERLIKLFEEGAKTAPEILPEAPWERNVGGSPKCNCGKCDGAGRIYMEGRGIKFCKAQSSRSSQLKGRSKEPDEGKAGRGRLDLSAIFQKRG